MRFKRFSATLLALAMCMGVFSTTVFAYSDESATTTTMGKAETVETVPEKTEDKTSEELPYTVTVNEDGTVVFSFNGKEWIYDAEESEDNNMGTGKVVTSGSRLNVRTGAGMNYEIIDQLRPGEEVVVVGVEGDWYQITSGNVTGYVKSEFVVRDNEELAKQVSRRVATVHTETLFVRTEPTTESDVLGMVPDQEKLTITDESVDGWTKVAIEEGDGYVSNDYVSKSIEFVTAESKAEEEARLAKEEAEREAAAAAAEKKSASKSSSGKSSSAPSGSGGSAVVGYACQFVGNPYVYGGTSLTNGADCSGFVMSVYAAFGVGLPHSSSAMQGVGYGVSPSEMQPGDIICYSGHVAIYVGNNTIVHASTPASGIKYTSPADYKQILAVRRIF